MISEVTLLFTIKNSLRSVTIVFIADKCGVAGECGYARKQATRCRARLWPKFVIQVNHVDE